MSIHSDPQQELDLFRSKYVIRDPQKPLGQFEDRPITTRQGLRELTRAPTKGVVLGSPPLCPSTLGCHTYIWVIDDDGLLFFREEPLESLDGSFPHHSNLPFDRKAYIGGELWFETGDRIFVSGGSGRYCPQDAEHLAAAIRVFKSFGYTVTSLGWDYDKDMPKRFLERPPEA